MNEAAAAGEEALARGAGGAMLYDASRIEQPGDALFDPAAWRARGGLEEVAGGRGTVAFVRDGARRWVLRHYRRGGLVASLLGDAYLWTGAPRTRAFAEWRLLRRLAAWQLPVPAAVAARYVRSGFVYRADLITEELPTRLTLAQALASGPVARERWSAVGRCIAAFHARGVEHADLNAHNVLLGPGEDVYLVDFDRGRIRERGGWEQRVLARLQRSLAKVTTNLPAGRFGEPEWQLLLGKVSG